MYLSRVPPAEMPEQLRPMWERSMRDMGEADFIEAGAHAPELVDWYFNSFYKQVFYGGRVPVRLKELLRLRLSKTHGCHYWNEGNSVAARRIGITDEEIDSLFGDVEDMPLSEAEKAVMRLADQMALVNPDGFLTAELYAALSEHYSDAEIFELGMTMAVLCGMAKFLFVYDLVSRETTCPIHKPAAASGE